MTETKSIATGTEAIDAFRAKVADRIREDIGKLMPDEMLQEIVKQSIDRELNAPVGDSQYNRQPWIEKLVRDQISAAVRNKAQQLVTAREDEITKAMTKEIAKQLPELLSNLLISILKGQAHSIDFAIGEAFHRARQNY